MSNGRCVDVNGERYEDSLARNRSAEEQCEYLLKCSLTRSGEKDGPYDCGSGCVEKLSKVCPSWLIPYPRGAAVAPYLFFLFDHTKNWTNNLPDFVLINGTVRCRNLFVTVLDKIISLQINLSTRQMIADHFCQPSRNHSWPEAVQSDRSM